MKETPKYKAYYIKHNRIIEKANLTTDENVDWTMLASGEEITLNPSKCIGEFIVMENTKCVDEEGTPIYEGYKLNKDETTFAVSKTAKGFIITNENGAIQPLYPLCRTLKVVGNIHEIII